MKVIHRARSRSQDTNYHTSMGGFYPDNLTSSMTQGDGLAVADLGRTQAGGAKKRVYVYCSWVVSLRLAGHLVVANHDSIIYINHTDYRVQDINIVCHRSKPQTLVTTVTQLSAAFATTMSARPSLCHTRESRLHGSRYRKMLCIVPQNDVSSFLRP